MRVHVGKAVRLTERMSPEDVNECNDLFWALAKYAENVEESAVQLDNISKDIYPELIELDEELWQDLKDMRSRIAHGFWDIDPKILWDTATTEFPVLHSLLSMIIVTEELVDDAGEVLFQWDPDLLLGLPDIEKESITEAGKSIVMMAFDHSGKVKIFRVGHKGNHTLIFRSNFRGKFSVYGSPIPDLE